MPLPASHLTSCRDRELAKFELLLKNEEALEINAMIRGRQRMAYPMKGYATLLRSAA